MSTYTYTIFDGNPAQSGPCAWPSHTDVEVEADSPEEALAEALCEAESEGDTCGEYRLGDTLHVLVWDADGIVVASGTHAVDPPDPSEPVGYVDWEAVDGYVRCVYGDDADEPGDCYTRAGQDEAGWWWADDGDDTERPETYGPFRSEEEARAKAQAVADEQNEAEPGEDADDMIDRLRTEAAGEPDPEGEYAVYWETVGDDAHPVERYSSEEAAEARAAQMQDGLHRSHPGGSLLCGYGVRRLVDGEWVETESA